LGQYYSVLIAHPDADTANGLRLAYNGRDSQSGWAAQFSQGPQINVTPTLETGAHAASLAAVARRQADAAYLDGYTWQLLKAYDPLARQVVVLGRTHPTPALPLITAKGHDPAPLQAAMAHACDACDATIVEALGVQPRLTILAEEDYFAQPVPPGFAGPQ
jgi:ABC-type phosphate/phosphonate transport system substrate-binding protein